MLEKLNQYRQNLTLPLRQKPAQNQYRFEWVDTLKELQDIQRFRAKQFSHQQHPYRCSLSPT
jgi:hypothetical protein